MFRRFWIAAGVALLCGAGGCASFKPRPIILQSAWIQQFRSDEGVDYREPAQVLRALLESTPSEVDVLPSEFYWYFQLPAQAAWLRGTMVWNLQSPDRMEFSYYALSRGFLPQGTENFSGKAQFTWAGELSEMPGCTVGGLERDDRGLIRRIKCFGISKTFHYPFLNKDIESNRARLRSLGCLLKGEEHWADFMDESGIRFSAIFLPAEKRVIEIVHPDDVRLLRLTHYPAQDVWHDSNTDFVFFKDAERYVLIGNYKFHMLENNYFDGPHDQLAHADMYVGHVEPLGKLIPKLGSYLPEMPVDEYGTFAKFKHGRFVIADHVSYEHMNDFAHVPKCRRDRPGFYGCLVREK